MLATIIIEMPLNGIAMEVLVNDTCETIHLYKKFLHILFLCLLSEHHRSGISHLYFPELKHRVKAGAYSNKKITSTLSGYYDYNISIKSSCSTA